MIIVKLSFSQTSLLSKVVCRTDCFLVAVLDLLRNSKALALGKGCLTFESQKKVLPSLELLLSFDKGLSWKFEGENNLSPHKKFLCESHYCKALRWIQWIMRGSEKRRTRILERMHLCLCVHFKSFVFTFFIFL